MCTSLPGKTLSKGVVLLQNPYQTHPASSCALLKDHAHPVRRIWGGACETSYYSRLLQRRYLTCQHQQKSLVQAEQPKCWEDKTVLDYKQAFFLFLFFF